MDKKQIIALAKTEWKNLEINKTTEDVSADLKQIQFSRKLKYFSFYAAVIAAGTALYLFGEAQIADSDFRKALVDSGMPPIQTLFVDDFADEAKEAKEKMEETLLEIKKLRKEEEALRHSLTPGGYRYDDFLADVAAGKVKVDVGDVKEYKGWTELVKYSLAKYMIQNKNETVEIRGKNYTVEKVLKKLASLSRSKAKKAVETPARALLAKAGWSEEYLDEMKKALLDLASGKINADARFALQNSDLPTSEAELKKHFKEWLEMPAGVIEIVSKKSTFKYGFDYAPRIEIYYDNAQPKFRAAYRERKAKIESEAQAKRAEIEERIGEIGKEVEALKTKRAGLERLIQAQKALARNPEKYEEISKRIKEELEREKI